jgi:hypothetical protein
MESEASNETKGYGSEVMELILAMVIHRESVCEDSKASGLVRAVSGVRRRILPDVGCMGLRDVSRCAD